MVQKTIMKIGNCKVCIHVEMRRCKVVAILDIMQISQFSNLNNKS